MSASLTRAEVTGTAYRVLHGYRTQALEHTVSVPADPSLTISEVLTAEPGGSTVYQVVMRRESLTERWQMASITPEPDPDVFPFNVTFYYPPDTKQSYGYSLRAVDKKAARKAFKQQFPDAKIWKIEDWYEF